MQETTCLIRRKCKVWVSSSISWIRKRNVVSIASEGIPEWLFTDMGTIGAGGISSGIYTTDSAAQVKYLVNDGKTKFILQKMKNNSIKNLIRDGVLFRENCCL